MRPELPTVPEVMARLSEVRDQEEYLRQVLRRAWSAGQETGWSDRAAGERSKVPYKKAPAKKTTPGEGRTTVHAQGGQATWYVSAVGDRAVVNVDCNGLRKEFDFNGLDPWTVVAVLRRQFGGWVPEQWMARKILEGQTWAPADSGA